MLQLHLRDKQFYCLTRCDLYSRFGGSSGYDTIHRYNVHHIARKQQWDLMWKQTGCPATRPQCPHHDAMMQYFQSGGCIYRRAVLLLSTWLDKVRSEWKYKVNYYGLYISLFDDGISSRDKWLYIKDRSKINHPNKYILITFLGNFAKISKLFCRVTFFW